jgi:translation elongation factor EF-1beta
MLTKKDIKINIEFKFIIMNFITPYIQTFRTVLIISGIALAIWFYKDWQFQTAENKRQSDNMHQTRIADSLRFSSQILTTNEIKEYLQYQNSDLKNKLAKEGVKLNRIESIVSTNYHYRDTTNRETDISNLVESIKNSIPKSQEWIDTSKCQMIKGIVSFDGQKLKVIVNDREFKNKSDAVAYWERRQWSFLGIKTRFMGKKQFTAKTFDECGESRTLKIEKKE